MVSIKKLYRLTGSLQQILKLWHYKHKTSGWICYFLSEDSALGGQLTMQTDFNSSLFYGCLYTHSLHTIQALCHLNMSQNSINPLNDTANITLDGHRSTSLACLFIVHGYKTCLAHKHLHIFYIRTCHLKRSAILWKNSSVNNTCRTS